MHSLELIVAPENRPSQNEIHGNQPLIFKGYVSCIYQWNPYYSQPQIHLIFQVTKYLLSSLQGFLRLLALRFSPKVGDVDVPQQPKPKQKQYLGGGWTNPFANYSSNWVHLPQFFGVKTKSIWNLLDIHHLLLSSGISIDVLSTVDGRHTATVEVGSLSHYFQGFIYARWCRISFPSTVQ